MTGSTLNDILARLQTMPPEQRKALEARAIEETIRRRMIPNPGPQTDAWFSLADELFYGGAAGGGKSALLCGLAIEEHLSSIIFRREFPQIKGLRKEVERIIGTRNGYNSQEKLWRLPGGNELEFGSVQHAGDEENYQGRPHDLKGFDEITHFLESQYRFLIAWNRSATPGQRVRVVATGNPPMTASGAWVNQYWGPWLDETHPRPAKPGELRWYLTIDGRDVEVDGPGPHMIEGQPRLARSRTFIPSKLEDNPDLMATGYAAVLDSTPEPMRTMMREGRFDVSQADEPKQVIPTAHIIAAQNRWKADGFKQFAMSAIAFDPAGGGADAAVIVPRYGDWVGNPICETGPQTADGSAAAGKIIGVRRDNCPVIVDVGGGAGDGFGGQTIMRLEDNGVSVHKFNGRKPTAEKTKGGDLAFANDRARAIWRVREMLDPDQEGGCTIALPPDPELRADLAGYRYEPTSKGILIEDKEQMKKRLGRSPGKGDAVFMVLTEGDAAVRKAHWRRQSKNLPTTANRGHSKMRRRNP